MSHASNSNEAKGTIEQNNDADVSCLAAICMVCHKLQRDGIWLTKSCRFWDSSKMQRPMALASLGGFRSGLWRVKDWRW